MNRRRPYVAPPMPFNRFTRPGLPDDRPAPYERDIAASVADDARQRSAALLANIGPAEIEALAISVGRSVGRPEEYALIALLRRLAPGHNALRRLDRISVELGYRCAGSDERLFGGEEFAR